MRKVNEYNGVKNRLTDIFY